MTLPDFIEKANKFYSKKEAIICGTLRLPYQELYRRSKHLAVYFQNNGIHKGDVISILHHNCHYFMEGYFAAAFCGAIFNPINIRLSPNEVAYILQDAETKVLIASERYCSQLEKVRHQVANLLWTGEDVPESFPGSAYENIVSSTKNLDAFSDITIDGNDIAHLYYTSGTTGNPKGVPLSHHNVTTHSLCSIAEFGITEKDNWLHAAPMFHLADAWATFAFTVCGAKHTMVKEFRVKQVFELIEREKITISNMIPTMLNMMVNSNEIDSYDLSSLRVILSGGAPIAPELVRKIVEKFGCDYIQTYGMTETCPFLTTSRLKASLENLPFDTQLTYKSKTGREFLGVSLRVVREDGADVKPNCKEVGEIIVKGDSVTKGYWKLPCETEKTIRNGWLHTGDLATIDAEGYVNIVDRKKDMIITGGENVYSTEVEYVIYEHPAVLEVAVIGVPDYKWGEAVKAFVVLKEGKETTADEVITFVKERIAGFKAPKYIEFIDNLPKTGSGKISKQLLRQKCLEKHED